MLGFLTGKRSFRNVVGVSSGDKEAEKESRMKSLLVKLGVSLLSSDLLSSIMQKCGEQIGDFSARPICMNVSIIRIV